MYKKLNFLKKRQLLVLLVSVFISFSAITAAYTDLGNAAYKGDENLVRVLIDEGVDVNIREDVTGGTALMSASMSGHRRIVEILINSDADMNAKNDYGMTALHWASSEGHKEVVELLISQGANINIIDNYGRNALNLARNKGHTDIVNILKKSNNVIVKTDDSSTTSSESFSLYKKYFEEDELIELVKQNPTESNYNSLSELRLRYATQFYKKWTTTSNKEYYEKALVYANSATWLNNNNDKAFALLGALYMQADKDPDALELATNAFVEALIINPDNPVVQAQLANVLKFQGRYWSAIEVFEDLFDSNEKTITSANTASLAECYAWDKRIETGVEYFAKLEKKHPNNDNPLIAYSVLLKHNDQLDLARTKLNKLIQSSSIGNTQKTYANYLLDRWSRQ